MANNKNYFDIFEWLKNEQINWEEVQNKTLDELWDMKTESENDYDYDGAYADSKVGE